MSRLDLPLWFATLGMEVLLAGLLMRRRTYKLLPVFTLFLIWAVASDVGMMIAQRVLSKSFFELYRVELSLDCIIQFGVLVELAWSLLRPLQSALPRWTVPGIIGLLLVVGAVAWPIAGFTQMHGLPPEWHFILRLRQTTSILQILFFVVLAAGSQLFSINWKDRELQVATGLGFYSLVNLAVSLLHAQMPAVAHYHRIDQLISASYLCSLGYWVVSFVQKEAPRHEFTPQMQSFLLTVSGAARAGRISLQENGLPGDRRG
jgi:hypothetical protein